jgi:hypothetical protein
MADKYQDYVAIKKVIGLYTEGARNADSSIIKPAFHKEAIIYSAADEIAGGPIQGMFDIIDKSPKATGIETEITAIDISSNTAYVRFEANNWNGARYSDMFLLLKDKNGWKIIAKVYHDNKEHNQ